MGRSQTIETWRAEFCVAMANRSDVDLSMGFNNGRVYFLEYKTLKLWFAYWDKCEAKLSEAERLGA